MASINTTRRVVTHEGGTAYATSPKLELERAVMSCLLWEDQFYEDGKSIADRIKELCTKVSLDNLVDITIRAKRDMRLRHVPLFLAREMLRTPKGAKRFHEVCRHIITRPDDLTEMLAMFLQDGKKCLSKQMQKNLAYMFGQFSEYQLAKYNGGQKAIKLRDAIRLLHPKPSSEEQAALWKRLVNDELATPDTWEVLLSAAKSQGERLSVWHRLVGEDKLGGLATLRNLRNMQKDGASIDWLRHAVGKINPGKLLPINFIAAARHAHQIEDVLEAKFLECFTMKERPKLPGETIFLVDVSVSMRGKLSMRSEMTRLDVAHSMAMIGRELCENVRVFTFSDSLREIPNRRGFALRDAIGGTQGGTQLGRAVQAAPPCDRLVVITDEQSSDPVPDMKGYMVNIASYKNGVTRPGQWVLVNGWSDRIWDYIGAIESAQ